MRRFKTLSDYVRPNGGASNLEITLEFRTFRPCIAAFKRLLKWHELPKGWS